MTTTDSTDTIRPYGPGKFSTILDEYVYQVSIESGCDDEESDEFSGEWVGMMRHGRTIFRDHDPFLEKLNQAERDKLESCAGVILREDSNGFVYVTYYSTEAELDAAWNAIRVQ